MTALTNQSQLDEQVAEQLDRDWTRASLHAEKQCLKVPPFPFSKELAQKRCRKNALGIIVSSAKWNLPLEAAKEKALQRCPGLIPDTVEECKQEFYTLQREIKALERDAVNLRRAEQEQATQERMLRGERAGAKALRNIKIAEESRESPEAHFAQVTKVHHLENWITTFEPMIRAEVHTRSEILRRHEGQTFIDEYFPVHHRMPRPIQLGQAGELQSLTPLDGG
jgi:hypothetical protein